MKNELFFLAVQRIKGTKRNSFLLGIILLVPLHLMLRLELQTV